MAKHKQETKEKGENKHTQGHTCRWEKQHSTMRKPGIPQPGSRDHMAQAEWHNLITSKQTTTTLRRNKNGEKKGETKSETRANVR